MRLYYPNDATIATKYTAAILDTLKTPSAKTEVFQLESSMGITADADGNIFLVLDYVPSRSASVTVTSGGTSLTVVEYRTGVLLTNGQCGIDYDNSVIALNVWHKTNGKLISVAYTAVKTGNDMCTLKVVTEHLDSTDNPHSTSLQQVTGGSFSINSGDIVSISQDISINPTGNITTTGEITADGFYGDLFGNLNNSTTVGTTGNADGRLASITTCSTANSYGRTTMDGSTLHQSLAHPTENDTTYYEQTCSVSGLPQLSTKTPAYATAVDVGTVRTQKLVASLGTYGEWVEYPYRNGSQTATSGAMQLVSGTTPYMTIAAAQIERGAQFRITGFFKRTQVTTNYTGGGGLRIVSNVGTGYVQPKTLTLNSQATLSFAVDFVLTAVDNGSGSWQLMQSQDAMLVTSYTAENTIITVPKSTDVPLYLWTSCANTIALGTDYKDYIAGFQVYRLR